MKTKQIEFQEMWSNLSGGERRLLGALMRLLKSAKRSHVREVARAAAKWEPGIGCFIKVRILHNQPRRVPRRLQSSSSSFSSSPSLPGPKLLTNGATQT